MNGRAMRSGSLAGPVVVNHAPPGAEVTARQAHRRGVRAGSAPGATPSPAASFPQDPRGAAWVAKNGAEPVRDGGDFPRLRDQPSGDGRECKFALCSFAVPQHAVRRVMFPGDIDGISRWSPAGWQFPLSRIRPSLPGFSRASPEPPQGRTGWTRSIRTAAQEK